MPKFEIEWRIGGKLAIETAEELPDYTTEQVFDDMYAALGGKDLAESVNRDFIFDEGAKVFSQEAIEPEVFVREIGADK
jgi:hypothetical protein